MKVYLAAAYGEKIRIAALAEELRARGIEVTSSWLQESHAPTTKMHEVRQDELLRYAITDLEDIDRADILVLFTVDPSIAIPRGGRHFETGYAYAKGKEVLVCGPIENIFHNLSQIEVKTWPEIVRYLEVISKTQAHVRSLLLEP